MSSDVTLQEMVHISSCIHAAHKR